MRERLAVGGLLMGVDETLIPDLDAVLLLEQGEASLSAELTGLLMYHKSSPSVINAGERSRIVHPRNRLLR